MWGNLSLSSIKEVASQQWTQLTAQEEQTEFNPQLPDAITLDRAREEITALNQTILTQNTEV